MRKSQQIRMTEEKFGSLLEIARRVWRADHQDSVGLQDPTDFSEQILRIGDLLEAVPDEHAVVRGRFESAGFERLFTRGVAMRSGEVRGVVADVGADAV